MAMAMVSFKGQPPQFCRIQMDLKFGSGEMLENAGGLHVHLSVLMNMKDMKETAGLQRVTIDDANELPDSWHCCDEHGGWPGTHRKNPWQPAAARQRCRCVQEFCRFCRMLRMYLRGDAFLT